ncbi:MAG TPA: VIT family protein [Candidatus Sulfotelmatobacter sp.]|nr:VIT family protein [Candidatus Sulfotelmatobacter sp.]
MEEKHIEPHVAGHISKLNWLRASVLGANDGIVSMAGLVFGLAGATNSSIIILTAGIAGIIASSISMAVGEYVSVSSSRDTEKALLEKERFELKNFPKEELEELAQIYQKKGLSKKTAKIVADELTAHDPIAAHFDAELQIDPNNLTNPYHAAIASAFSFLLGGAIPLLSIILTPVSFRIPFTFTSVLIALCLTGIVSAKVGGANIKRAVIRVVIGGIIAMAVTYGIGKLFNLSGKI